MPGPRRAFPCEDPSEVGSGSFKHPLPYRRSPMRFFGLTLTTLLVLSLSACSGKSDKEKDKGKSSGGAADLDSVMKDAGTLMNEKAEILESIKDKETAEKAKPKLEAINKKKKELEERRDQAMKDKDFKKLAAEMEKLEDKYKIGKATIRLTKARDNVLKNKEAASVLKDIDLK
jgi:hypothetical protein